MERKGEKKTERYNIVLEGKGDGDGNYKGIRTWKSFSSKAEFIEFWENSTNSDVVIAEGVSQEEAEELCFEVKTQDYFNAAVAESMTRGKLDQPILELKLANFAALLPKKAAQIEKNN